MYMHVLKVYKEASIPEGMSNTFCLIFLIVSSGIVHSNVYVYVCVCVNVLDKFLSYVLNDLQMYL